MSQAHSAEQPESSELCCKPSWKVGEVVLAVGSDVLAVVAVGEGRAVGLAHAVDHDDARPFQPATAQLGGRGVLEETEQAKLLAARSGEADLVVAAHAAVHGLPLAASTELRRRCSGDSIENGVELGLDLGRTVVQEVRGGNAPVFVLVVLDLPGPGVRLAPSPASRSGRALGALKLAVAVLGARDDDDVRVEVVGDLNDKPQLRV
jgi:hypothetical protein